MSLQESRNRNRRSLSRKNIYCMFALTVSSRYSRRTWTLSPALPVIFLCSFDTAPLVDFALGSFSNLRPCLYLNVGRTEMGRKSYEAMEGLLQSEKEATVHYPNFDLKKSLATPLALTWGSELSCISLYMTATLRYQRSISIFMGNTLCDKRGVSQ